MFKTRISRPWAGEIRPRHTDSLVSRPGAITPFALQLADRGRFVEPGQQGHEGMVVGQPRPEDLDINVTGRRS